MLMFYCNRPFFLVLRRETWPHLSPGYPVARFIQDRQDNCLVVPSLYCQFCKQRVGSLFPSREDKLDFVLRIPVNSQIWLFDGGTFHQLKGSH